MNLGEHFLITLYNIFDLGFLFMQWFLYTSGPLCRVELRIGNQSMFPSPCYSVSERSLVSAPHAYQHTGTAYYLPTRGSNESRSFSQL